MTPMEMPNATRILGEEQEEYHALPILDQEVEGVNCMTSRWQPTAEELEMLNAGGAVLLTIIGMVHPPVMLRTQSPLEGTEE